MKNLPEFHPIFMTTGSSFEEFIYLLLFLHAMYLATIERFIFITLLLSCWFFSLNCNGLLSFLSVAHEIIEHAKDYDIVVIGTIGRSGLSYFLTGSVAEKVVRHAPVPVLVVRTKK